MKNKIQTLLFGIFGLLLTAACSDDEGLTQVDAAAPVNISADFSIKQDNSGEVTIYPSAEGANSFNVDFGDGSGSSEEFTAGHSVSHTYTEGTYQVMVTAKNAAGRTAEAAQELVVSFKAPENLEVGITKDAGNPLLVYITAMADYAASYEVFFGEDPSAAPTVMMPGETISYEYSNTGLYTIEVVALSGGQASTSYSEEIEIVDPFVLPVTFESSTVDYTFYNFGGGEAAGVPLVENPASNSINESATVASYTKPAGSETWAGTSATLNENIDFSSKKYLAIDVYSPAADVPVLFKVEKAGDNTVFVESTTTTTAANEWETLYFDMSAVDDTQTYSVLTLFFNFNIPGTGETYYFDNIRLESPTVIELPVTFEKGIENYAFTEFGGSPTTVVANPHLEEGNMSATVAQLFKSNGSETWAGAFIDLDRKVDFTLGESISMKVWSSRPNIPIILKFENPADGNIATEATTTTTKTEAWETVTFNYTGVDVTQTYQRMVVFMDYGTSGTDTNYYFDDVKIGDGDVETVSLFSEDYTDVPVDTWRTEWSAADYEETTFDGSTVKKYSNLNYVGIETTQPTVEASEMTYFHTEVYSDDFTAFRVKLVDFGANGVYDGGGDDVEHEIEFTAPEQGTWVNLDIPLSDFTNLITRAHIAQLIYSANPAGSNTVYIKNVYFHN
tara:strand:+ start:169293 stop:171317 length:2025 start_codon:yes stop_codon:yes gene_type:complete